jgi:sialic acid synthase SpsE
MENSETAVTLSKEIINTEAHPLRQPFVIAEAGVNHEGSLDVARRLIYEAADGGADAIKFQTYRADTIAVKNSPAYWDLNSEPTTSQHALFSKYDSFWKGEFEQLKSWCDQANIEFLSTPFDLESAMFLNDLMSVFKISSSDITNKPFIQFIAGFGKPLLISTGASNLDEVDQALTWIDAEKTPISLMHCILNYPTPDEWANLAMIRGLKKRYSSLVIGYSDHTLPADMESLHTAWLVGAQILEKHFTHDKSLPGNDHYHAMDTRDLKKFREKVTRSLMLLGSEDKQALIHEESARQNARRSLVTAVPIKAGTVLTKEMLTWKRPADGISPARIDQVVGRKVVVDIASDQIIYPKYLQSYSE